MRLREVLASNQQLAQRFAELEARLGKKLATHDQAISAILAAIRGLMAPPVQKQRGIGFTADIGRGVAGGGGRLGLTRLISPQLTRKQRRGVVKTRS